MKSRVAVITGAGRGIGRAIAISLAQQGHRVVLVARSEDQLRETTDPIAAAGGVALALPADVADVDAVDAVQRRIESEFGPPQILINAAGVFGPIQLVHESDPRRWIETQAINVNGPYLTCRAFVGKMVELGWGRIVNVSSAAAFHSPGPLNSAYGTSKVALNHFTRHLAAELAGSGVTANVIHPGEVKTQMWATIHNESQDTGPQGEGYRAWAESVGASGGDDPQKAVDLVLRLVSDEAADTNGRFLWIEGGMQTPIPSW